MLDLKPGYDLVNVWHVLEHVRRPRETLARIHDLLAPGGVLVLAAPNGNSWQARCFGTHWFHHDPPRHLFQFGRASLLRLLAVTGFEPRGRVRTMSFEQNVYGWVQSALNAAGFPRDRAYRTLQRRPLRWSASTVLDLSLAALLTTPAALLAILEAAVGRGGSLVVTAQKVNRPRRRAEVSPEGDATRLG